MTAPVSLYRRFKWADVEPLGEEDRDFIWQAKEGLEDEHTNERAESCVHTLQTAQSTSAQCEKDEDVHWGGWHPYSDATSGGTCFLKLIDGDTGAIVEANSSEELRLIALRCAKAEDYIKGTLYFLQTRIAPCTSNRRRCKKHSVKWYVDIAQEGDQTLRYYQE